MDAVVCQVRDFVSKLPGVRQKTLYALLNRIDSLLDLLDMSEVRLATTAADARVMGGCDGSNTSNARYNSSCLFLRCG